MRNRGWAARHKNVFAGFHASSGYVPAERRLSDPDGPPFVNPDAYNAGGWWSETALRRTWYAACDAAGVERVGVYEGTKHPLGTALKDEGVDDRVIAALFGHTDVRSVLPYSKVRPTAVGSALARLGVSNEFPTKPRSRNLLTIGRKLWWRRESNLRPQVPHRAEGRTFSA